MINITVVKNKQNIVTIEASGHSGYEEEGKDIVCSAVSAITQSLILGLKRVLKLNVVDVVDPSIPHLSVTIKGLTEAENKSAQILMQTAYLSLKEIRTGYEKFIKIKEKQL